MLLQSQRMRSRPGTPSKIASDDPKPAAMCNALGAIHRSLACAESPSGCPARRLAKRSSANRVKSASLTGTAVVAAIASSSRSRRGVPHSGTHPDEVTVSLAAELGLTADDAIVIQNSNRLAVRLVACDVLARIAPTVRQMEAVSAHPSPSSHPGLDRVAWDRVASERAQFGEAVDFGSRSSTAHRRCAR